MKTISLWQPWASAIAYGAKRVETRSWKTDYRGPLAIHAAKRFVFQEIALYRSCYNWMAALPPLRGSGPWVNGKPVVGRPFVQWLKSQLPLGAIVATCEIADCRPSSSFTVEELDTRRFQPGQENDNPDLYSWTEGMMGDFSLGRFGWILKNIRRLETPISVIGRQGFFEVSLRESGDTENEGRD